MGIFGTSGMDEDLDRGPYATHLADSAKYIRNLRTDEEKIVAMWCRVHRIALEDEVTESRVVRLYYESLCLHPEREVARLFDAWNEPIPHVALKYIRKASRMTQEGSRLATPAQQVARWQTYFSDVQIARMARILSDFEMDVYGEDPLPKEHSNP